MDFTKKFLFVSATIIIFAGIFIGGFYYGRHSSAPEICQPFDIKSSVFCTAYRLLQQKFVDPSKISAQNIVYGAISGMAQSLGDPYTVFFKPEDNKKFNEELSGSFDGVGIEIGTKDGQLTVISPLEGSPAQAAGIRAGDVIVKIDGKDASSITADQAVTLIRGPKGTSVTLSIYRVSFSKPKDFTITRQTIEIPSLKWELIDGNIARINIYQFGSNLNTDFNKAALEILKSPAKKIVLDLRNDPGGFLDMCQDVAGWFLPKDSVVVKEVYGDGQAPDVLKAEGNAEFSKYPIVILINEGSASASEILAGALRDDRGIQLIGEKSFGKGSVQEKIDLEDTSSIKITVAKWYTPSGVSISEKGLMPDVKLDITDDDITKQKDPQLDKAIEILGQMQ